MKTLLLFLATIWGLTNLAPAQMIGGVSQIPQITRTASISISNTTGQAASCLTLNLSTGGALSLPPANVFAPSCPTPTVQITRGQITINWGTACVPNGSTVVLLVSSSRSGILQQGQTIQSLYDSLLISFVSGFWTGPGGGNIGNVNTGGGGAGGVVIIADLGPTGPGGGPCVITSMITYVPQGPPMCGPPMPPMGMQTCWTKECVAAPADCFVTISKNGSVTSMIPTGIVRPPFGFIMRITNMAGGMMMPLTLPGTLPVFLPVKGPSPDEVAFGAMGASYDYHTSADHRHMSFRQDFDGIQHQVRDLPVLFGEMHSKLELSRPRPGGVTGPIAATDGSYAAMIDHLGPRYTDAAETLVEMTEFLAAEEQETGDSRFAQLSKAARAMQESMAAIGHDMSAGAVTDSRPFAELEAALLDFGGVLASFDAVPSESHANCNLIAMAEGVAIAKERVLAGLPDATERDFFLYGMQNRFNSMFRHLSDSLVAHTRIKMDLGPRGWYPSTMMGVLVRMQDADTNEVLETRVLRLSDLFEMDIPDHAGRRLRVWFKVPGFLSEVVEIADGVTGIDVGALRCGDANGDNFINANDIYAVLGDLGEGGMQAVRTPATDVNADGCVNLDDLIVVLRGQDQFGEALPNI